MKIHDDTYVQTSFRGTATISKFNSRSLQKWIKSGLAIFTRHLLLHTEKTMKMLKIVFFTRVWSF